MILISSHGLYESITTSMKDTVYFLIKNTFITVFYRVKWGKMGHFFDYFYNILNFLTKRKTL